MRYATVVIAPAGDGLQPADRALAAEPTVTRDCIQQINLLNDGTCVTLYSVRGDLERAADILDGQDDVFAYDVSGEREGLLYVHFQPTDVVERLLSIPQDNEIVLQMPIDCLEDGSIRTTLVGDDATIRAVVDAIPDSLSLSLEGIGDYHPESEELFSALTPRQQEILEAAVEMGYYEVPRGTTHREIAEVVGVSAGTVGEHLRKVEGKVLSTLVR
ncbi:helix-turn-helix domain-containing protein [Natronomonas salina]|uniref:helix-turn-helix domain-containing protein n=1 Tax=Natronomonas salina TaxID=1710540 RepID=UPI0015B3F516|nr:helix-turn-helix domain-containing protein [Natronomonas salina]QLD88860.1 helix-turn-helix domain-containing protein [Natronomonas salina]